jgi:hypothetical protein
LGSEGSEVIIIIVFIGCHNNYMFDFLNKLSHNHVPPNAETSPPQELEHNFINSSSASEDERRSLSPNGQLNTVILPRK